MLSPVFNPDEMKQWLESRPRQVIPDAEILAAAVLVPIFVREGEMHLLFTKRSSHVSNHRGQISFPGGRVEPEDASLLDTALRESEEEIGLRREDVKVLGPLDDSITLGKFRITPYVGMIPADYAFVPDPREVDYLIEVPLRDFLDPGLLRTEEHVYPDGVTRPVYFYTMGDEVVWGATARIIKHWLDALTREADWFRPAVR